MAGLAGGVWAVRSVRGVPAVRSFRWGRVGVGLAVGVRTVIWGCAGLVGVVGVSGGVALTGDGKSGAPPVWVGWGLEVWSPKSP